MSELVLALRADAERPSGVRRLSEPDRECAPEEGDLATPEAIAHMKPASGSLSLEAEALTRSLLAIGEKRGGRAEVEIMVDANRRAHSPDLAAHVAWLRRQHREGVGVKRDRRPPNLPRGAAGASGPSDDAGPTAGAGPLRLADGNWGKRC